MVLMIDERSSERERSVRVFGRVRRSWGLMIGMSDVYTTC